MSLHWLNEYSLDMISGSFKNLFSDKSRNLTMGFRKSKSDYVNHPLTGKVGLQEPAFKVKIRSHEPVLEVRI